MFCIGDKVVYPMHGAGIITDVEKRDFDGAKVDYLVITMLLSEMKVMVPAENAEKVGLRKIVEPEVVAEIEELLQEPIVNNIKGLTWNRRFNLYLEKMKKGTMQDVAEIIGILQVQENEKKISTGERRLLGTARHILVTEVMLVMDKTQEEAEDWLNNIFEKTS